MATLTGFPAPDSDAYHSVTGRVGNYQMIKTMRAIVGSMLLAGMTLAPSAANAQMIQCAPFARMFSGIQLFGAAASWWNQAVGKYLRGDTPMVGAVMVFKAIGSMRSGHVATVTQVVSDRVIKITHANWSIINGRRGQVERDVTVVDASPNNDWSRVKVWFAPIGKVGTTAYPVNGFIYKKAGSSTADAVETVQG
ncbi:amidase [Sphingomonas sp. Root50]|nr:amidase [Sphingomonas sp. Root1294]KQY66343.1 amidase [Sphingomonas sp. Root50]KRB90345.1 amidase [Sphingomonas sp. Root720]